MIDSQEILKHTDQLFYSISQFVFSISQLVFLNV